MPYDSIDQLPKKVTDTLPKPAQEIFVAAYNSAHEQYDSPSKINAVAWSAVKNKYHKNNGQWVKK